MIALTLLNILIKQIEEIVTCKDCKHNDEDTCGIDGLGVRDDYFCSSDERRK